MGLSCPHRNGGCGEFCSVLSDTLPAKNTYAVRASAKVVFAR
jgi:hypothetical protein